MNSSNTQEFSLSNAKANLSKLIRQVKAGQQVTITECGVPVAVLSPFEFVSSSLEVIEATNPLKSILSACKKTAENSKIDSLKALRR